MIVKSLRTLGILVHRYRAHILVDLAVAAMVLALPLGLRAQRAVSAQEAPPVAAQAADMELPRAQAVSRSATITAGANPATRVADDVKKIQLYTLGAKDTLQTVANYFGVSAEAVAASNGITEPTLVNQQGREIMIPPAEGVLYTVQPGDTVEAVATKFKVEPKAIMDYNRLYFEPEHFAPQKLVFVPGAQAPALVYATVDEEEPTVIARPAPANNQRTSNGRLSWPVQPTYISQYFWALHTGVDMPAPYGTGIGASAPGTVIAAGWVAVGGLSVRIRHEGGLETGYYHLGSILVAPGQKVERGQIIGTIGMTGVTTGPHVHWEAKQGGQFVNPLAQ